MTINICNFSSYFFYTSMHLSTHFKKPVLILVFVKGAAVFGWTEGEAPLTALNMEDSQIYEEKKKTPWEVKSVSLKATALVKRNEVWETQRHKDACKQERLPLLCHFKINPLSNVKRGACSCWDCPIKINANEVSMLYTRGTYKRGLTIKQFSCISTSLSGVQWVTAKQRVQEVLLSRLLEDW